MSDSGDWFWCSLSSRTMVYKGMLRSLQVTHYFPDLQCEDFTTFLCMVHSRFATNTFPSWDRAQPCRQICHNGEINTLRGNMNYAKARQGIIAAEALGITKEEVRAPPPPRIFPLLRHFDVDFLGRSLISCRSSKRDSPTLAP